MKKIKTRKLFFNILKVLLFTIVFVFSRNVFVNAQEITQVGEGQIVSSIVETPATPEVLETVTQEAAIVEAPINTTNEVVSEAAVAPDAVVENPIIESATASAEAQPTVEAPVLETTLNDTATTQTIEEAKPVVDAVADPPATTEPISNDTTSQPDEPTPLSAEDIATARLALAAPEVAPTALAAQQLITSQNINTGKVDYYTDETTAVEVVVNGQGLTSPIIGGYVDIVLPTENLDIFTIPKADLAISNTKIVNTNGTTTVRVMLDTIDATTFASFYYNYSMRDNLTPKGYTVTPQLTFYNANNEVVSQLNSVTTTTLTKNVGFQKGIGDLNLFSDNNHTLVGVLDAVNPKQIDKVNYYPQKFFFNISTTYWSEDVVRPGLNRIRKYEEITITDKLPTYKDAAGNTHTALFDPAVNPGWVDNGDGTVSYVVKDIADMIAAKGADKLMGENLPLILYFPEVTVTQNIVGTTRFDPKYLVTNEASVILKPYNESVTEAANRLVLTDNIKFYPEGELLKVNANISKTALDYPYQTLTSPGSNHYLTNRYSISAQNPYGFPI